MNRPGAAGRRGDCMPTPCATAKQKIKLFLKQAEHDLEYMLNHPHMPKDLVPYWDYDAPKIPNEERDASAAAIMASGLYELSLYSKNGKKYRAAADKIMESLTNTYRSVPGENQRFYFSA
jgi:unsaturated chondroitin disaccharide hydrolase